MKCGSGKGVTSSGKAGSNILTIRVLSLFVQVMMVQLEVDKKVSFQVYGLQDHHLMVCDALGIDRLWYASPPTGQNRRMSATPP